MLDKRKPVCYIIKALSECSKTDKNASVLELADRHV